MTRFEFLTVFGPPLSEDSPPDKMLSEYGEKGWCVCAATPSADTKRMAYIMARTLPGKKVGKDRTDG